MLLGDTRIMARLQANTAFLPSKFVSVLNRIHEYCTGFGNVTTNGNATTQCFLLQPLADTLHHATSEEQATAYQSVVPDGHTLVEHTVIQVNLEYSLWQVETTSDSSVNMQELALALKQLVTKSQSSSKL